MTDAKETLADIVEALRAECRDSHSLKRRPDGPTDEELKQIGHDLRWRAAAEIEQLRGVLAGWQPISSAPKDAQPVLLFCPGLNGNVAREIVIGVWKFDANRRTFGYWVSDVGHLDEGQAETGAWIEYVELQPKFWAPLLPPPRG
ncbi:hypothetical protein [Reyranella sp.]|uniref:hypothetical protein n=1 Tax=Reyranella sp. TaxID=1929291 RepID=UPI0037852DC8